MPTDPPTAPTLYLIDGHAQMFRSFFAIRTPMTSPVTGEPTGASFAFTGMLLKLMLEYKPQYAAMAIDTKEPTYRNEIFPEYKAQRESPPEEFSQQIPRMLEITEAFGIPVLGKPGAEADDIIATLATRLTAADDALHVAMVSKDKDLYQLLAERVYMMDIHTGDSIDVDKLVAEKGFRPEQAIDIQTLCGDSVDNIPGVKGIGPKTAVKLLEEFQTLDNLMANLDQVKGKRRENLEAFADQLEMTRNLVSLVQDVEIDFELNNAAITNIDAEKLHTIFRDLGFHRHVRDLEKLTGIKAEQVLGTDTTSSNQTHSNTPKPDDDRPRSSPDSPNAAATKNDSKSNNEPTPFGLFAATDDDDTPEQPAVPTNENYTAITTEKQLDDVVAALEKAQVFAVDTETIGLGHRTTCCGICLSWQADQGVYIPLVCPDQDACLPVEMVQSKLQPAFSDPSKLKVAHNLKYDYLVLKHFGLDMVGPYFDTMVAAFLLNEPGMKLDDLVLAKIGHHMVPIERLIGPKPSGRNKTPQRSMAEIELDVVTQYAAEDADMTLRLYEDFAPRLKQQDMTELSEQVEMPLAQVLADMEHAGIRVDPDTLDQQRDALQLRIDSLRDEILELAGVPFNVDSPKQLGEVLFETMKLPVIKKTKSGASTDAEVLEKLAGDEDLEPTQRRVPELVLEYRQLTKLVGTYLVALKDAIEPETGRVHARFHQTGAATGRLSSSDPNLQNIPIRTDVGRQIRKAFVAEPEHKLVSADYSQIELRMLAHLSEDPALIAAFTEGQDIHTAVAAEVFDTPADEVSSEQRASAKVINFGIIYGVTAYGLSRRIEGLSMGDAKTLIKDYRKRFAGIDRFLEQCVEHAKTHGYVSTIMNRRRNIDQIKSRNPQARALGERLAINTVVQGSAADLIKIAMVNLHRRIEKEQLPMRLLLQIHDELVVETPADQAEAIAGVLCEMMESAMSLKVPLKADPGMGSDWFDAK